MRVRWIGLTLALLVVGAAIGYGVGGLDEQQVTAFDDARPVPAADPALPFDLIKVEPDPIYPTLRPGLRLTTQRLGTPPFDVTLPVPRGWVRTNPTAGEWRWYPGDPDDTKNTYFIRARLVGNGYATVRASLDARIAALGNAEDVLALEVEQRDEDSFVASYVSESHRRVSMERFFPNAAGIAYAYVVVIGREQDRDGMADLLARITEGIDTAP